MTAFPRLRQFLVSAANLLEAEGRALRGSIAKLALALGGIVLGLVVMLGGAGLLVASVFFALQPEIGRAWALLVCAAASIGVAGLVSWLAMRLAR